MSGLEVCARIKGDAALATIQVLQISSTAVTDADRVRGLSGGADAYLTEPTAPGGAAGDAERAAARPPRRAGARGRLRPRAGGARGRRSRRIRSRTGSSPRCRTSCARRSMRRWAGLRCSRAGRLDADRQARAVEALERSTRQQWTLINELLDAASIQQRKMRIEMSPVDLDEVGARRRRAGSARSRAQGNRTGRLDRADPRHRRSGAAAAGDHQPAEQRGTVHDRGRSRGAEDRSRRRRCRRPCRGFGDGDRAAVPPLRVRGVPAGGFRQTAAAGWALAWPSRGISSSCMAAVSRQRAQGSAAARLSPYEFLRSTDEADASGRVSSPDARHVASGSRRGEQDPVVAVSPFPVQDRIFLQLVTPEPRITATRFDDHFRGLRLKDVGLEPLDDNLVLRGRERRRPSSGGTCRGRRISAASILRDGQHRCRAGAPLLMRDVLKLWAVRDTAQVGLLGAEPDFYLPRADLMCLRRPAANGSGHSA